MDIWGYLDYDCQCIGTEMGYVMYRYFEPDMGFIFDYEDLVRAATESYSGVE